MYKVNKSNNEWNVEKKWKSKYKTMKKWPDNNIGDEGAVRISESLMINTTLTELYLFCDDNIVWNVNNNY